VKRDTGADAANALPVRHRWNLLRPAHRRRRRGSPPVDRRGVSI
jgi:hypothetical protein